MDYKPFQIFINKPRAPWVIICDHASNLVPESIAEGNLGLNKIEMQRHIAFDVGAKNLACLLYTSPSPRDRTRSRMPSSA